MCSSSRTFYSSPSPYVPTIEASPLTPLPLPHSSLAAGRRHIRPLAFSCGITAQPPWCVTLSTDFEDQAADLIDFVTKSVSKDEEGIYITPDQARKRVAGLPLCDEWDEDYDLDENFKMGKKLCRYTLAVKDGVQCKKIVCN